MNRGPSAAPDLRRGLLVLLLAALAASSTSAQPARSTDPFADLDAINIRLEIGEPLDLRGSVAPELLVGDVERFNRFRSSLEQKVGAKLESCGILWDQGAVDEVSIMVFGRREDLPQGPAYVYMVRAEVLNTKLAGRGREPDLVALRPVIGLADDAGLERALIETAVGLVAGELRSCDGQDGG